jgi:hypothetical protein
MSIPCRLLHPSIHPAFAYGINHGADMNIPWCPHCGPHRAYLRTGLRMVRDNSLESAKFHHCSQKEYTRLPNPDIVVSRERFNTRRI